MAVGLQLAGKNDFVRVQEDINDNLIKLDEAIDFNLLATLGIEYGGILNNTEAKAAGKAYYDTVGKKLYKCIANTSINYADAGFFEAISNNDLLKRLNNARIGASSVVLEPITPQSGDVKFKLDTSKNTYFYGLENNENGFTVKTKGLYNVSVNTNVYAAAQVILGVELNGVVISDVVFDVTSGDGEASNRTLVLDFLKVLNEGDTITFFCSCWIPVTFKSSMYRINYISEVE